MNKSLSKYYNTALLMNQALIELLSKKDYEYITVKEICDRAGVNRSTFYLHYEKIDDLLEECVENSTKKFLKYFDENEKGFIDKIKTCSQDELILITPKYLTPYLNCIKDNKLIYQVAVKHALIMKSLEKFNHLNKYIFQPIFQRFNIDAKSANYYINYYLHGVDAVINEWIKDNCKDEIKYIEDLIIKCIRPNITQNKNE